jgi:1-aminocyclopropane-1-carboxylate deaminase
MSKPINYFFSKIKNMTNNKLKNLIKEKINEKYIMNSRIHKLKFSNNCYIKREDELSFGKKIKIKKKGISGTKFRKFSSLIPFLKKNNIIDCLVHGNSSSNNILSITQLLIENDINPIILQKKNYEGLSLDYFLKFLVDPKKIKYFDSSMSLLHEVEVLRNNGFFIIEEGSSNLESIYGSLTLPLDIIKNEIDYDIQFDNIFMDCGTGLSAISNLLGLSIMKEYSKKLNIIQMYEFDFEEKIERYKKYLDIEIPKLIDYEVHRPSILKSFGSTNNELEEFVLNFSRREGVLIDIVFNGKLFFTVKKIIEERKLIGNNLIVHSGGALSLIGYSERFLKKF